MNHGKNQQDTVNKEKVCAINLSANDKIFYTKKTNDT